MSYDFAVGQKVVCGDDDLHLDHPLNRGDTRRSLDGLTRSAVYTISWVGEHTGRSNVTCLGIRVSEITRPGPDTPYGAFRFRPVEPKSAELFRAIAADPSKFTFTPSKRERERVRT